MELIKEACIGAAGGGNLAAIRGIGDPGERGHVNKMRCAELSLGVMQRIAKDETTFGVGVGDLDTLPVEGGDHITRSRGVSAGHVLNTRSNGMNRSTWVKLRNRCRSLKHGDGAVLVVFHLFHLGGWLQ